LETGGPRASTAFVYVRLLDFFRIQIFPPAGAANSPPIASQLAT
jgi:hypothetical protein